MRDEERGKREEEGCGDVGGEREEEMTRGEVQVGRERMQREWE